MSKAGINLNAPRHVSSIAMGGFKSTTLQLIVVCAAVSRFVSLSAIFNTGGHVHEVCCCRERPRDASHLTKISPYSYYGRRIRTRVRSIKWCHFQWSWTNPNPVFKLTPLFDAKCLTNSYRYGHSYYRRRIGNRTQAFEWYQIQWSWVTSKPDFKVTIVFNVK